MAARRGGRRPPDRLFQPRKPDWAALWPQTLPPPLREVPAEAEAPSHRLMLRAGYIRKLGSGSYSYLPLGMRSLAKVSAIIRQEMAAAGAQEVLLPALHPIELWEKTGRREAYGQNLFVVKDRHGREAALGPTHEEVVTELVGAYIASYKDLPLTLYQIQTKFRDEYRPRFGVLRSREFQMKDAYSFHLELEGPGSLDETYRAQYDAYCRIFERCGLTYEVVEAESGPIGGSASHEFMVPAPTGEDLILQSDQLDSRGRVAYAANVEKCEIGDRPSHLTADPTAELAEVHTPGCATIDDVCAFFKKKLGSKLKASSMLKTLVCRSQDRWVIAVVRGDHDLNEAKLRRAVGGDLALADEAEARAAGFTVGFVGPHAAVGRDDAVVVIDPDAAQGGFWVTGANQADTHVKGFNWQRELGDLLEADRGGEPVVRVADIRNAVDGDPVPGDRGGGTLRTTRGIEVGHVFKLGTKYTEALGAEVLDEQNQRRPLLMGCYGIGVNRILAAAIERTGPTHPGHDADGIIWPAAIAPYRVLITALRYEPGSAVQRVTDQLAREFEDAGCDVLIDDRDERPGVKFKDADLVGIPLRITVGDKGLETDSIEVKARNGANGPRGETVRLSETVTRALALLGSL